MIDHHIMGVTGNFQKSTLGIARDIMMHACVMGIEMFVFPIKLNSRAIIHIGPAIIADIFKSIVSHVVMGADQCYRNRAPIFGDF